MSLVQLADMKSQLNVTFTNDDTLIQGKIDAAEDWISQFVGAPWPPSATYPAPWGGA